MFASLCFVLLCVAEQDQLVLLDSCQSHLSRPGGFNMSPLSGEHMCFHIEPYWQACTCFFGAICCSEASVSYNRPS